MGCGQSSAQAPKVESYKIMLYNPKKNTAPEYCQSLKKQWNSLIKIDNEANLDHKTKTVQWLDSIKNDQKDANQKWISKDNKNAIQIIIEVISEKDAYDWLTVVELLHDHPDILIDKPLDSSQWTLLHYAARYNNYTLIDLLLKQQYRIDGVDGIKRIMAAETNKGPVNYDKILWKCDAHTFGGVCKRGHVENTEFDQRQYPRYECRPCSFDLCDLCAKEYMIKLKEDEDEKVKIVEVATHPHKLIFRPVGYDNIRWHCDSITMGLACGRGHFKGVFEERDHPRYECRDCNFDLCDLCMLAQQKQQGQDSKEQIKETQEIFKNTMEIQKEMQITMKNKLKEEKKEQINPLNQQKDILFAWVKQEEQKVNELEQKLLEEQNSKEQKELEHLNNIPFQFPNQDFQYLKILSSTNQIWIDPEFPHCLGSITKDQQNKAIFSSVQWKLPIEFFPKNLQKIQVFDKVEANDIIQGSYDISYMLSLLAAIAEYPERLIRVFNSRQYQEKGVYSVTLFNLGFPEEGFKIQQFYLSLVVIDSYFPVDANQNELIFAKPNGKELWVLILEKAWAKFLGAYTNCEEIPAKIIMNHLLGIPSQSFWIKDFSTHELKMNLFSYQEQQFIMVAASKPECKEEEGLLPEYSYSILNIFQGDNLFLIKLRNPQGNLEFCGDYGYNSKKWTDPLIQKTGFNRKNDDGIFFLTIEEFEKYFHHLTIGMFKENYSLSTIASDKSSKSSYFKIVNSKDQEVSIVLNQSLQNQVKSRTSICLLDSDGKTISYGNESECNYGGQTISIFSDSIAYLKQGTYLLKAKLRNSESNGFSVSLYSTKDCTIEKENKSEYVKLEQKRLRILGEERTRCKVQPSKFIKQKQCYFFRKSWRLDSLLLSLTPKFRVVYFC